MKPRPRYQVSVYRTYGPLVDSVFVTCKLMPQNCQNLCCCYILYSCEYENWRKFNNCAKSPKIIWLARKKYLINACEIFFTNDENVYKFHCEFYKSELRMKRQHIASIANLHFTHCRHFCLFFICQYLPKQVIPSQCLIHCPHLFCIFQKWQYECQRIVANAFRSI